MAQVFKISKPGYDVLTASNENLVFSSAWDSLKAKTVSTTTVTLAAASTSATKDIAHDLSYIPAFFTLVRISTNIWTPLPFSNVFSDLSTRIGTVNARSNGTNLRITVNGFTGASDVTLTIKYYIFYNQLD